MTVKTKKPIGTNLKLLSGNPALWTRHQSNGISSLFLEYYLGRESIPATDQDGNPIFYTEGKMAGTQKFKVVHNRKKITIPDLFLYDTPNTPQKKLHNSNIKAQAEQIRILAEDAYTSTGAIYGEIKDERKDIISFLNRYCESYKKKDIRMIRTAIKEFTSYLNETPNYKQYANDLPAEEFTKIMVKGFAEYLEERHKGEGAHTIFARFKKMAKNAYETEYLERNPCDGVVVKKAATIGKEVLTKEEIEKLINTHVERQSQEIRRAFLFSLFTGIRWCDVKDLTYANFDKSTNMLVYEQNKTKGHSSASWVKLQMYSIHMELIGAGEKDELIFKLPSHNMCLKSLRRWVERAGIDKHITWHCARHSYGTNLINDNINPRVVAAMLGHSSLQYITRYTQHIEEAKSSAMDKLTAGFSLNQNTNS